MKRDLMFCRLGYISLVRPILGSQTGAFFEASVGDLAQAGSVGFTGAIEEEEQFMEIELDE